MTLFEELMQAALGAADSRKQTALKVLRGDRRALVFAASVAQAERLAEILNRHREASAAWVCGKTDKEERRGMLAAFAAGKLQYVVNVGCLTEGFDDAGVEVIIMGRPTKSRSLYAQMVGRATRPAEEIAHVLNDAPSDEARRAMIASSRKPGCLIVDFVGNSGKHKLCTTADILGGNVSDAAVEMALKQMRESGKPVDTAQALSAAEAELARRREEDEAARRARLVVHANYRAVKVSPFDVFEITPRRERGWDSGRQLSEKQRAFLCKQGVDADALPYHEAKQLLDEMFRRINGGLASYRQTKVLKKNGFAAPLRREEAGKILDRVAREQGWRRAV